MENEKEKHQEDQDEKPKTETNDTDPTCPLGYIWDKELEKCVLDVGK